MKTTDVDVARFARFADVDVARFARWWTCSICWFSAQTPTLWQMWWQLYRKLNKNIGLSMNTCITSYFFPPFLSEIVQLMNFEPWSKMECDPCSKVAPWSILNPSSKSQVIQIEHKYLFVCCCHWTVMAKVIQMDLKF